MAKYRQLLRKNPIYCKCQQCNQFFELIKEWKAYCSNACSQKAYRQRQKPVI